MIRDDFEPVSTTGHPAPRRKPVAALMSMLLPGLGQLYNGEVALALRLFLAFALLAVPGPAVVALHLPASWTLPALVLGLLSALGLWSYAAIQAWRSAGLRADWLLQPWQTGGLYLLVLLLGSGVGLPALIQQVRAHWVESFHIPSASMAPTLMPGDILFADKRYNCPGCKGAVRRGDIVIFVDPNDRTRYYVKRVAGLPGEAVAMPGQPATTVPPGTVYLLGDNVAASTDSRQFGPVPLADVVGRVRQIWWSSGDGRIRWERLGLTPQ